MNITESLKVTILARLKLFGWMLAASFTAGLAIYLAGYLAACGITFWESMALLVLTMMRSSFEAFAGASKSGIDMDNSITVLGVNCQELLGLLDSPSRKATILLGKPL